MPFELVSTHPLPLLKSDFLVFRDRDTGLRHVHLPCGEEYGFLVALPTRPTDNRGAAHVLEHMSLGASEKYPFPVLHEMKQRTAATYLNAETHSDATFHLFSTPVAADFFNLMDVLVHGAFFPRLDRIDFLQEAWRFQLDGGGRLSLDGVVFNEMQGILSDPEVLHAHALAEVLHIGTSLAQESGGDPLELIHLTHEALVDFHARWAHPAHAVVLTSGPMDPGLIQAQLGAWIGARPWPAATPLPAQGSTLAHTASVTLPVALDTETGQDHRLTRMWLLDTPTAVSEAEALVMGTLLTGEGGALSKVLDSPALGRRGPCGLVVQAAATTFEVCLEGLTPERTELALSALNERLDTLAQRGVPPGRIAAAFRHLETEARRQADADDKPFLLGVLGQAADALLHGRDPAIAVDQSAALSAARHTVGTPEQVAAWIGRHLRDNPRGIIARSIPDTGLLARRAAVLDAFVAETQARLTEVQRQGILADQAALAARVHNPQSADALPALSISDLHTAPPALPLPEFHPTSAGATRAELAVDTHGLVSLRLGLDLSGAPASLHPWLGMALGLSLELGVGTLSQVAAARWRAERGQDFGVGLDVQSGWGDPTRGTVHGFFEGWAQAQHAPDLAEALVATWRTAWIDPKRGRRQLIQNANALLQDLAAMGDDLALDRCLAHLDPARALQDGLGGWADLAHQAQVRRHLQQGGAAAEGVFAHLESALATLRNAPVFVRAVADDPRGPSQALARAVGACAGAGVPPDFGQRPFPSIAVPEPAQTAWTAAVDVHSCWQAFAAPRFGQPDAPACEVLAQVLTQVFLMPWLREQGGAYDGSCFFRNGVLIFRAFRSPRLSGAYADIERAMVQAGDQPFAKAAVDRGILAAVRDFDLDQRGRGEDRAEHAWQAARSGWTPERRRVHREGMMAVTASDLRRVAQTWLRGAPSSRVAVVPEAKADEAQRMGLVVSPLLPTFDGSPRPRPRP